MRNYTFEVYTQRIVTYMATVTVRATNEVDAIKLADTAQEDPNTSWEEVDSDCDSGPDFRLVERQETGEV